MTQLTARALLFDMDGTLVDSTAVVERIWGTYADRFGLDLDEILASSHGVRMVETIRRHTPDVDADAVTAELGVIEYEDTDGIVPVPGAVEFVAQLPQDVIAVVTSATRPLAALRLEICGLPFPAASVTAEEVERGKPDPLPYLVAASRLGVDPADCIVFEDAEAGILAGLAAGMQVVVVGEHESPTTEGLPRMRDYVGASASTTDGVTVLEWNFS